MFRNPFVIPTQCKVGVRLVPCTCYEVFGAGENPRQLTDDRNRPHVLRLEPDEEGLIGKESVQKENGWNKESKESIKKL
jgi:hypothetical protein